MNRRKRTVRCDNCPVNGFCLECWRKAKKKQNAKVHERRRLGLCIWCGKPAAPSRLNTVGAYCKEHKVRRQVWGKGYRVRVGTATEAEPDPLRGTHVRDRAT